MAIVSSTEFRKNMSRYVKESNNNKTPLIVTTQKQGSVVVVPIAEWEALQETLYLTTSPKNRARLDTAVQDIRNNKFASHNLIEE